MGRSLLARAIQAAGGAAEFERKVGRRAAFNIVRRTKLLGPPEQEDEPVGWRGIGRPEQLIPDGDQWRVWLILAGRGFGKTRTGAEAILEWVKTGQCRRIALVAPTAGDARDVMVEGESGILAVSAADGFPATYEPSKRRVTWPNGAIATLYSAEEPDRLRGPQHDGAWCDELASWKNPQDPWDMLQFGLRLGQRPRIVVTTTPRPIPLVRKLIAEADTILSRGKTRDNSDNLAPSFLKTITDKYEGTRLGKQEMDAEILDDNPGALWKMAQIDALRKAKLPIDLKRIGVGVDPAVSSSATSDETGIVAAGIGACNCKGFEEVHGFVFDDRSGIYTPDGWAKAVAGAYHDANADMVVPEVNNGGDLVVSNLLTLGDKDLKIYKSPTGRYGVHASRGKRTRAEPISGLYEQGKVHHVGALAKLEDQMTQWDPLNDADSPDRVDALVWVLSCLMLKPAIRSMNDVV